VSIYTLILALFSGKLNTSSLQTNSIFTGSRVQFPHCAATVIPEFEG